MRKEDKREEDLQSSEWNFVNDIDGKFGDELNEVTEDDNNSSKESNFNKFKLFNKEFGYKVKTNFKKHIILLRENTKDIIPIVVKIIISTFILYQSISIIYNVYRTYKLENMIGAIDDFSNNDEQKKTAFEKCRQAYLKNAEMLESCVESKVDPQSCLDYYTALLNKNKDFCKWNVATILSDKQRLLSDLTNDNWISRVRMRTRELLIVTKGRADLGFKKVLDLANEISDKSYNKLYNLFHYIQMVDLTANFKIIYHSMSEFWKSCQSDSAQYINKATLEQNYLSLKEAFNENCKMFNNLTKELIANLRKFIY